MTPRAARLLPAVLCALALLAAAGARADEPPGDDQLFESARKELADGRPGDAIAELESLADRGVVDAAASYNRGLAYADRVRIGAEQPGDLGRAAQGFEEARTIATDPTLTADATRALLLVRAEVARRRARAGEPVELDQGTPLGRTIVELVPEDVWAGAAAVFSLALGLGLFVRGAVTARRPRIGATLVSAIAGPLFVATAVLALASRSDRLHLREGIIVTSSARPADERGIVLGGQSPLPEATRVQIVGERPGWLRVRWGALDAWLPTPSVRTIARPG